MIQQPWAQIPLDVAFDDSLTLANLRVYLAIDHLCGKRGYWYCDQSTIAERTRLGERTVQRAVAELRAKGYIITSRLGAKQGTVLRYELPARTATNGWWSDPPNLAGLSDRDATDGGCDTPNLAGAVPQIPTTDPDPAAAVLREWERATGMTLTPMTIDKLDALVEKHGQTYVLEAISETNTAGAKSLSYLTAILNRWQTQGRKAKQPDTAKPAVFEELPWIDEMERAGG